MSPAEDDEPTIYITDDIIAAMQAYRALPSDVWVVEGFVARVRFCWQTADLCWRKLKMRVKGRKWARVMMIVDIIKGMHNEQAEEEAKRSNQ